MKNEQLTMNRGKAFLFLVAAFCVIAACKDPESEPDAGWQYDPDLNGWRTASWAPFVMGDKITAFAYGNVNSQDRYVAVSGANEITWDKDGNIVIVSETGKIAWSKDGDIWKKALSAGKPFRCVCYGKTASGGRFVAAGDSGLYTSSKDGENWSEPVAMNGFNGNDINGIAFGKGFFVAVGGGGKISYSADGEDWKPNTGLTFYMNDVAYDSYNKRFYIVGEKGKRAYTDDPSGSWVYLGEPPDAPMGDANILKVTAGRYGENDPKNIGDGTGIGMVYTAYYKDGSPVNRCAVAIKQDFSFGANLDKEVEQFLFDDYSMNGVAWGGGNFVTAGSCAMIGYWPSAESHRIGERFFRAISFPDFKKWEISAIEACNGRFFIGNVDGKIGYSK